MRRFRWSPATLALTLLIALAPAVPGVSQDDQPPSRGEGEELLPMRIKPLPSDARRVFLLHREGEDPRYVIVTMDGGREVLDPDAFTNRLLHDSAERSWLFRLLNITSSTGFWWVTMGLLGQVLFTGRMVLQWLVSERSRRSVVPVGFWWMSLLGATMLLVYFIWRRDIVGVLGQSTGWLIYVRNLWMIYRERLATS